MTGWVVRQFRGPAPRIEPRLLQDDRPQTATNVLFRSGALVPLADNSASVVTLSKAGTILTAHRFGLDVASDAQYWFHWAAEVDVARGPVFDDAQERTYFTDGTLPKVTDSSIALSGGTDYPMGSYVLGVPAPTTKPVAVVSGTPESGTAIAEDRVYYVTFVTTWGEEGMPSDASNTVTVKVGEDVDLDLPDVPTGSYSFAYKRIYRSVAGTGTTELLYVDAVSAATSTYKDSVLADGLGESCPSLTYEMPPATLQGLVAGPNGVMAGFDGKYAYFCEPNKPHAWPSGYAISVAFDIVAIQPFGSSWLILTKGAPTIVMGSHPDSYTQAQQDLPQACISKRSAVAVDGGVAFASPDGLFVVGSGGARNVTEETFTNKEWRALVPSSLSGYVVDNLYVGFFSDSETGIVIDLSTGDFCYLDWYASAGYYDPQRDALFLVIDDNKVVKFNAASALDLAWKSKPFYSPRAVNLGAGRVEAHAYDNGSTQSLTMKVYADGTLKHTQTVTDGEVFRLPDGFMANTWEFQIDGNVTVTSAGFAETVQELARG